MQSRFEYRVTWQRIHWKRERWKVYQAESAAFSFADRVDAGQDRWGLLKELKVERRPVGQWVEHHEP